MISDPAAPRGRRSPPPNSALAEREADRVADRVARLSEDTADVGGWRSWAASMFDADFSSIRLHAGAAGASESAGFAARALTRGRDIVFGAGQYRPEHSAGRHRIAHELTHAVQQGAAPQRSAGAVGRIGQRIGGTIAFDRDIGGGEYAIADLGSYLGVVRVAGAIEDHLHSDDKARAIVAEWRRGGSPFTLSATDKILLIQEMQSGFTGDEDEWAILEILWRSSNADLVSIFGVIGVDDLNSDFHGTEWHDLERFYAQRFVGGMAAVASGTITPVGSPVPFGVDLSLIEGLEPLSASERTRASAAITTEVRTSTGALPTFERFVPGEAEPWERRVADEIDRVITALHTARVVSRPPRVAANMLDDPDIDRVAGLAQAQTDAAYSSYYGSRPAFSVGSNIFDAFEHRDVEIAAAPANADRAANFRVLKLLNGDDSIGRINAEHGAIYTRAAEWALIAPLLGFPPAPVLTEQNNITSPPHVVTGIVGTRRAELLDIHRNWSAFALPGGRVFLDRMRASTAAGNRDKMYRIFGTVIHEYIHTLEHADHQRYRSTLAAARGGFTLREGVTEYLAKLVWERVDFNNAMRAQIEGSFQDPVHPDAHPIRLPPRYSEWQNAERLAGVVGLPRLLAAFFLGRVQLIGAALP